MNKSLDKVLSSPEFTSSFAEIFFTNRKTAMENILKRSYLKNKKRPNAKRIDNFLSMQPASRPIAEELQPFIDVVQKEFNTKKGAKGVPFFLEYFREKLRADFCNARFAKSDNTNVLSNVINSTPGTLLIFRSKLLRAAQEFSVENIPDEQLKSFYLSKIESFSSYILTCDDLTIKDLKDKFTVFSDNFYKRLKIDTPTGSIEKPVFDEILTRMFIEQQLTFPEDTSNVGSNLIYNRIRRDINLGFDQRVFQALINIDNLIASYQLGLINDEHEIVFNGEYFLDRKTGKRVTQTSQPINEHNITSIGRGNQSSFVLPENMVYGMRGSKNFGNPLSFTTQHDNIYNGENFTSQNPLLYFNKKGFFGKKRAEYSVHSTTTNSRGKTVEYTHTLYKSLENDTDELYVKVAERVPDEGHVKFTLYAFPLNHVGAGVQICRVENNPQNAQRHTLKGNEKIYTSFHIHQYNLIDQMYVLNGSEGHFDITYKLKDSLTDRHTEAIFNFLTKIPNEWSKNVDQTPIIPIKAISLKITPRKIYSYLKTQKKHYNPCSLPQSSQIFRVKQNQDPFKLKTTPISATDFEKNWSTYSANGFIKEKTAVCALTHKVQQHKPIGVQYTQPQYSQPMTSPVITNAVGTIFANLTQNQVTMATKQQPCEVSKEALPKPPTELPISLPIENKDNSKNDNTTAVEESLIVEVTTIEPQLTKVKVFEESLSTNVTPEK